jgi:hypothetical protein
VIPGLRHLPVPWTQLPHHNVTVGSQCPARIQLLAPELLASCGLVRRQLCWDCSSGAVGSGNVLCVDLGLGGSDVVGWLPGSGGGGLRCGVIVWVRIGVPLWRGDIRIVGFVIVLGVGRIVAIVATGSRVAVITSCRSLRCDIIVAVGVVWRRCWITRLLRSAG